MQLGIMQPYFFPYLGHFSLIANTDEWIVFDITQYTPKTWMNRNRVLHPKEGTNYVTVALANSSVSIKTCDAKVLDLAATKDSVLGKLSHYRRRAPHYAAVKELVEEVFAAADDDSLVHLNTRGLQSVCRYLGIPFRYRICSELGLPLPPKLAAGEWALEICALLGVRKYVNPIGGREIFDAAQYARRGIALHFLDVPAFTYDTAPYTFEPNLSILDVLMWNAPQVVREAIGPKRAMLKAAA